MPCGKSEGNQNNSTMIQENVMFIVSADTMSQILYNIRKNVSIMKKTKKGLRVSYSS